MFINQRKDNHIVVYSHNRVKPRKTKQTKPDTYTKIWRLSKLWGWSKEAEMRKHVLYEWEKPSTMVNVRSQKEVASSRRVIDWKGSQRNFWGVTEIFYILFWMMVVFVNTTDKIHQTQHLRSVPGIVYKLYLKFFKS